MRYRAGPAALLALIIGTLSFSAAAQAFAAAAQAPQTQPAENWAAPEIVEVQAAPGLAAWHLRGESEVRTWAPSARCRTA